MINVDSLKHGQLFRITSYGGGRKWFLNFFEEKSSKRDDPFLRKGDTVVCLLTFERARDDSHVWVLGLSRYGLGVMGCWKGECGWINIDEV